MELL
ncbi:putative membrane protein, partial [Escherichia coli FDA505]|jgi:hypothetical protein